MRPDGNGKFRGIGGPAINDAGQVLFSSGLIGSRGGDSGANSDNVGIFRADGTTIVQIARENQAVAGRQRSLRSRHRLSEAEQPGAGGVLCQLPQYDRGKQRRYRHLARDDTSLVSIVREGQMAPDANGVFASFTQLGFSPPESLNNLGQVAFDALLTGTTGGGSDE